MLILAAVAVVALLLPVGARAAGSLVTLVDPVSSHKARVSSDGRLSVAGRAAARPNSNFTGSRLGLGYINLTSVTAPTRLAVSEVTLMGQGPTGQQEALIEAFVRTSGTNGCTGPGTAGYTRFTLRRVAYNNEGTLQVLWNGPALTLPSGASGQPTCFGITVISIPSGSATYIGATAFTVKP
jgi:hypothetical protein